jgi:cyclophilin family peptidyl-prolyl cis-trans isomerase
MIKLATTHGDILVARDAEQAPKTCADFKQHVHECRRDVPARDAMIEQAGIVE